MRFVSRRCVTIAGLLAILVGAREKSAHADLIGADVSVLSSILTEDMVQVANLVQMLVVLRQQLAASNQMLAKLDPSSFEWTASLVRSNQMSYEQLTGGVSSIGYTLGGVNAQFRSTYDRDFTNTPASGYDAKYTRWHEEVLAASEVAARSQSSLATLQSNNDAATTILRSSASGDGVVAQLQAVNQMLAVIVSQNNTLIQSLASTGRVLASTAGEHASEAYLAREKKKRNLSNYLERGDAVPPMTKLP